MTKRTSGISLVLGGARSGKSTWAETLASRAEGTVYYIATAEAHDDEMRERIELHRQRRDKAWQTIEAPLDTAEAVTTIRGQLVEQDVLLIDCLTLFISNWLLRLEGEMSGGALVDGVLEKVDELIDVTHSSRARAIIVSNETGSGIVPAYPLGRVFRDMAGIANQRTAAVADHVYLTVAGIPVDLKALRADRSMANDPSSGSDQLFGDG